VAGLNGGGTLSFSKASERLERPVCFGGRDGSPGPSDEAGFIGDGSLGGCRFGSEDGFWCREGVGAFPIVLFSEDDVGIANEKAFL